jgi:hypothetical protein
VNAAPLPDPSVELPLLSEVALGIEDAVSEDAESNDESADEIAEPDIAQELTYG